MMEKSEENQKNGNLQGIFGVKLKAEKPKPARQSSAKKGKHPKSTCIAGQTKIISYLAKKTEMTQRGKHSDAPRNECYSTDVALSETQAGVMTIEASNFTGQICDTAASMGQNDNICKK